MQKVIDLLEICIRIRRFMFLSGNSCMKLLEYINVLNLSMYNIN
jgi:hypothetical protein